MPTAAALEFIPPHLDRRVLTGARLLLPLWMRQHGLRSVNVEGMERLQDAMEAFQKGQSRLLLAFRHPSVDDPAVLAHLLWYDLARAGRPGGRDSGKAFRIRPHAQFLYDRGIPLWAGAWMGWLFSRLGGCSIQRGGLDLPALRTARALLLDGPYPFAVAPEGATNGHNEVIGPLEPGVAQLAFWTADDLVRAGRRESTLILPVGVQYRFIGPVWSAIAGLLRELEAEVGLPATESSCEPEALYRRLFALAEVILTRMERFYREGYHQPLPDPSPSAVEVSVGDDNARLAERLNHLLEAALRVAEQSLGVEAHGDWNERCRRLEQAGWERLYPGNGRSGSRGPEPTPSPLEQGLTTRLAEETERSLWHMRLVESFVAVSGRYVRDNPSQERFADTLLILWDTLCRIRGGNPGHRPRIGPRRAHLRIGEPLAVTPRLEAWRQDRRGAVGALTADLQQRMEELIRAPQASERGF